MKQYLILILLVNCLLTTAQDQNYLVAKKQELTEEQLKTWYFLDYTEDTIPGISLDKAYRDLIKDKKGQEVIVAVIDTKLDIQHEDLKGQIWVNTDEIPDNGIDDDNNGYIDDIHGWNYLGNKEGEEIIYSNHEVVRIIRKYKPLLESFQKNNLDTTAQEKIALLQKAEDNYESLLAELKKEQQGWKNAMDQYPVVENNLAEFFPKKEYSISKLDSLLKVYEKNRELSYACEYMRYCLKNDIDISFFKKQKAKIDTELKTVLGFDYNDRDITGDDPENINNTKYGNPKVWNDSIPFQHAILVGGILAANRHNDIGIKGVSNQIKVMSLCVASSGGDEHDKDIALAIRYAVDNGAKVINMSFGKEFSLYRHWVDEALKYAEKNDVLIIGSAGNEAKELNKDYIHYPTNYDLKGNAIVNNFIKVGASTRFVDQRLRGSFSNYGKERVDIFAPGAYIYSTRHNNAYGFGNGTSYSAPLVSGIAALIKSYYPTLAAKQIKQILIKSGTVYDVKVEITQKDGTKTLIPFSELSKSGKIVNAYNALIMAEKLSK